MSLTIKQARRMVAKSRRRVWRLARRHNVTLTTHDRLLSDTAAHLVILAMNEAKVPGAASLLPEYLSRRALLTTLEWGRHRAWAESVVERIIKDGDRRDELPALDHGQDGDELLQDVADYYAGLYADPRLCPVCSVEMDWIECDHCGGEGGYDNDALMEEDPLWYDGVEWEDCGECRGKGGWWQCPQVPHEG